MKSPAEVQLRKNCAPVQIFQCLVYRRDGQSFPLNGGVCHTHMDAKSNVAIWFGCNDDRAGPCCRSRNFLDGVLLNQVLDLRRDFLPQRKRNAPGLLRDRPHSWIHKQLYLVVPQAAYASEDVRELLLHVRCEVRCLSCRVDFHRSGAE